jgi:general secretion pathway protein G
MGRGGFQTRPYGDTPYDRSRRRPLSPAAGFLHPAASLRILQLGDDAAEGKRSPLISEDTRMKERSGFTLVEVLVVTTVMGILAAIVVPQFSSATNEAQAVCLRSNLHAVRKQVELYKVNHNGVLPAVVGESSADFVRRMTAKTDRSGAIGTEYGPYLERVPVNTFNQLDTVRVGGGPAGANTDGWRFDPATEEFQADDSYDGDGDKTPDHISF